VGTVFTYQNGLVLMISVSCKTSVHQIIQQILCKTMGIKRQMIQRALRRALHHKMKASLPKKLQKSVIHKNNLMILFKKHQKKLPRRPQKKEDKKKRTIKC
ncbi:hypothetical protein JYU34_010277, partial [Plutella xylostella]